LRRLRDTPKETFKKRSHIPLAPTKNSLSKKLTIITFQLNQKVLSTFPCNNVTFGHRRKNRKFFVIKTKTYINNQRTTKRETEEGLWLWKSGYMYEEVEKTGISLKKPVPLVLRFFGLRFP